MRRQKGYILLMTLVLLALAAMALTGVCRMALRSSVHASERSEALQQRWGMVSCRTVVLPQAERLLAVREKIVGHPVATARFQLVLGGAPFDLLLSDEQAKPSLTTIDDRRGRAEAQRLARAAIERHPGDLRLNLHPVKRHTDEADRTNPTISVFSSFGQVYVGQDTDAIMDASSTFTCWGTGRLNWRRVTATSLAEVTTPILGPREVRAIIAAQSLAEASLEDLLDGLRLSRTKRSQVSRLLQDGSTCYALWVAARPPAGRTGRPAAWSAYAFSVVELDGSQSRYSSFRW